MFEEQVDTNQKESNHESGFEGCFSDEDEPIVKETHAISILDFFDTPKQEPVPKPTVAAEETKADQKPQWKKEVEEQKQEPAVVADPALVEQLIQMGFPADLCKKALAKVKTESLEIAVEAVMELQEAAAKEKQSKPKPTKSAGT